MSAEAILELKKVTKKIGRKTIIEQVSFDLHSGEVFGLLGPNGSGKTMTIRMIVGLIQITSGDILIKKKSIKKNFTKAIREVGAVVETPELYNFLTGYQNLLHYARMSRPNVSDEEIMRSAKLMGLEENLKQKVKTYSLGMRQRLGIAQAIMHHPTLLILDEPTNGLDPAGIRELRDYLRTISHEKGIGVLVSSHQLSEMELMCDRVAILQKGKVTDIRSLKKDFNDQMMQERIAFEVNAPSEAILALKGFGEPVIEENLVLLFASYEEVAIANYKLVEAGIKVYGIKVITKSLEDQFLEVTRGG